MNSLADHLWQSTLFALAAGLMTLALRNNRARVRHGVWLAASVKFLIPLSLLIALGNRMEWRKAPTPSNVSAVMIEVSQPFTAQPATIHAAPVRRNRTPEILLGIWACGFLGICCSWWVRWRRVRNAVRAGSAVELGIPVSVVCSPTFLEPGIFGVFRQVLLLPQGIFDRLTQAQLEAVIEHELCHVRHRDNLAAALHMVIEMLFWFHPLVWWIGKRMIAEREKGCDEEVVMLGGRPRVYAEAILSVCKLYVESPLACVAGVTGSDLKKRIEAIMTNRAVFRLNFAKKASLTAAGFVVLALPVAIGTMNVPAIQAQSPPAPISASFIRTPVPQSAPNRPVAPKAVVAEPRATLPAEPSPVFEVVSIRPSDPNARVVRSTGGPGTEDPGIYTYENGSLEALVAAAYEIPTYRIKGPYWMPTVKFVVSARVPPGTTKAQFQLMMHNMLAERFQMSVHREKKDMQMYDLVVAKGGPKLKMSAEEAPAKEGESGSNSGGDGFKMGKDGYPALGHGWTMAMGYGRAHLINRRQTLRWFAEMVSNQVHAPVDDATGIAGIYDFELEWAYGEGTAAPDAEPAPTLFEAVQSQLGLRLEPKKGPVDIVVVDYAERSPTGN
jgi:bla regulator protein BlaR1